MTQSGKRSRAFIMKHVHGDVIVLDQSERKRGGPRSRSDKGTGQAIHVPLIYQRCAKGRIRRDGRRVHARTVPAGYSSLICLVVGKLQRSSKIGVDRLVMRLQMVLSCPCHSQR